MRILLASLLWLAVATPPMPALDPEGRPVQLMGHVTDEEVLGTTPACIAYGLTLDDGSGAVVIHLRAGEQIGPAIELVLVSAAGQETARFGSAAACDGTPT